MCVSEAASEAKTSQHFLEVQGLSKSYGPEIKALEDVSFSLETGILGLLGPNGAGKSTLMNILATLLQPDQGSVSFNHQSVLAKPEQVRRYLGFLPQSFGVYPRTSAWQLLNYLAILKGIHSKSERHQHVQELLELTHLWQDRHRSVAQFSGGMKQRFGLAQALLGSPRVLIVDEPTAGLDPFERNHFHQVMGELAERMIILLSTHLVTDIANLCSKIMILNQGRKVYFGDPGSLIARLDGQVWAAACHRARLVEIAQTFPVLSVRFDQGQQRVHVLAPQQPRGFSAVKPDLEDAYFAVLDQGGVW